MDNLKYEHLIYANDSISVVLSNIFTWMLRRAFVPSELKRGVITTLYKGGNKPRNCPDSYRVITLSSVLFKLYENIILQRSKSAILENVSIQQGGFQDGLGCIYNMTSFVLREIVAYAR